MQFENDDFRCLPVVDYFLAVRCCLRQQRLRSHHLEEEWYMEHVGLRELKTAVWVGRSQSGGVILTGFAAATVQTMCRPRQCDKKMYIALPRQRHEYVTEAVHNLTIHLVIAVQNRAHQLRRATDGRATGSCAVQRENTFEGQDLTTRCMHVLSREL